MNKRLHAIANLVQNGKGLVDVGTDHGYLPAYLAVHGYPGALYASDIHTEPLMAAKRTAEAAGVSERIRFLLCDGLALCPPEEIDTIVIAGMGGDLIVKILDEAEWCMDTRYRLILQPMTKAEVLRYWLVNNGFALTAEHLVEDGGILYQIIVTAFGGSTRLCDAELFAGKQSLCAEKELYSRQLELLSRRFRRAIDGMRGKRGEARLALYQEIWAQLQEMRRKA